MRGKNNEDRYAISAFRVSDNQPIPAVFAIVADGVGGHHAGEVAAEMAVEQISQAVAASDATQPVETLSQAIIHTS
jgi:protein phosphatase